MDHLSNYVLILLFCFLVLLCCFFSLAETSMMSLNRYRLKHLARHKNRIAKRVLKLIERPDRLLGLVLFGSTFSNILVSAVFTILAIRLWGEENVGLAITILAGIILIFGEIAPKIVAVSYPLRVAFLVSGLIKGLLILFSPLVWGVNKITNGFLRLLGVKIKKNVIENLSQDELRTLVNEAGTILPSAHKNMLLSLLDLEKLTIEDIMVPRGQITGIDLSTDIEKINYEITHSVHLYLPVYEGHINDVKGMLKMRDVIPCLRQTPLTKDIVLQILKPIYFIPMGTPLISQLLRFRRENERCGLVVDEYGDVQGFLSIEDILEEVVGDFSSSLAYQPKLVELQEDGSCFVNASINLRDLNKQNKWQLPVAGPKTLSGLIVETLGFIPPSDFCLRIDHYLLEIVAVKENKVRKVKVRKEEGEIEKKASYRE